MASRPIVPPRAYATRIPGLSAAYPVCVPRFRYDPPMAREKNTARSAARRRTRVAVREQLVTDDQSEDVIDDDSPAETAPRRGFFTMPNVRDDIRALPEMFRTRRLLWVPFLLLIVSFVAFLAEPTFANLDPTVASVLVFLVQSFFLPTGLLTFLVAGLVAPRAAYLVGFLLGILNSVLLVIAFAVVVGQQGLPGTTDGSGSTPAALATVIVYALVIGPLAAAFGAWYRSFLNRMNENNSTRRAQREAELARKRKEEQRAARRPAKTRTSA
jgi:hypothetical protein